MFSVVYTLAMPGEDCDTVIPADSDTGRIITSRILQLEDDEHSLEWVTVGDTDFTLTALVYNEMFPKGRKGASVKEVADLLGVSADVVRASTYFVHSSATVIPRRALTVATC